MSPTMRYEITAEAFRIMTGHMAPGKDASAASQPAPYDERLVAWSAWLEQHGKCVRAMILAVDRMMPEESAS